MVKRVEFFDNSRIFVGTRAVGRVRSSHYFTAFFVTQYINFRNFAWVPELVDKASLFSSHSQPCCVVTPCTRRSVFHRRHDTKHLWQINESSVCSKGAQDGRVHSKILKYYLVRKYLLLAQELWRPEFNDTESFARIRWDCFLEITGISWRLVAILFTQIHILPRQVAQLVLLRKYENICNKITASVGAFSHFNLFWNCAKKDNRRLNN